MKKNSTFSCGNWIILEEKDTIDQAKKKNLTNTIRILQSTQLNDLSTWMDPPFGCSKVNQVVCLNSHVYLVEQDNKLLNVPIVDSMFLLRYL